MELSGSNIKKYLIFSWKVLFFYFRKQNFFMLQETETPNKFLIFSPKKALLIFRKRKPRKKFLVFQETKLSYNSQKVYSKPCYIENPDIFRTLPNIYDEMFPKMATVLYSWKWGFLSDFLSLKRKKKLLLKSFS